LTINVKISFFRDANDFRIFTSFLPAQFLDVQRFLSVLGQVFRACRLSGSLEIALKRREYFDLLCEITERIIEATFITGGVPPSVIYREIARAE